MREGQTAKEFMAKIYALRGTTFEEHVAEVDKAALLIAEKIRQFCADVNKES